MVDILINSETLRNTRDSTGMNQKDFAEFLGIGYRTYQNYETGHPIPDAKKELIAYKLRDIEKLNTQKLDSNIFNSELEETEFEYEEAKKDYKVKSYKELVELMLKVVANFDEMKDEKIIQNLFTIERLKAELKLKKEREQ